MDIFYNNLDKHDKIWGYVSNKSGIYVFWGARTATIYHTKKMKTLYDAEKLSASKIKKGYKKVKNPEEFFSKECLENIELAIYAGIFNS